MNRKRNLAKRATTVRRGWRIPATMPKDFAEAARLRAELGPRAGHRSMSEWPRFSDEERERLEREFKEPTPSELRAFRLRHGVPRDWMITKCLSSWVVESPAWPRTRPTAQSKYARIVRVYSLDQQYFDEFHSDVMEIGTAHPERV